MKTSSDKNNSDIEMCLKNMRPKSLSQKEKQAIWSKISSAISADPFYGHITFASWLGKKGRGIRFIAGVVVVVLLGGTAAFAAADNSGPGDFLYPLDLASEKIVIAFASKDKKAELKVKYSEERLEEARKIVTQIVIKETALVNASESSDAATTTVSVNTATSTSSGTSTPPAVTPDHKGLGKAKAALTQALDRLEATKRELEASGNINAAQAVGKTIERLTDLADEHLQDLEKVKVKIRNDDKKLKIELSASTDDIKTKFKFEERKGKKAEVKIRRDEDDDLSRAKSRDDDDEDREERGSKKVVICHISGKGKKGTTITVAEQAIRAHLAHGDKLGQCIVGDGGNNNGGGGNATTTPDILAPVISQVVSSNIGSTTASISWITSENASSKIYYGTSSPLVLASASVVTNAALVLNRSLIISSLQASTTQYFVVESKDASNNTATSSENSFITLP